MYTATKGACNLRARPKYNSSLGSAVTNFCFLRYNLDPKDNLHDPNHLKSYIKERK